MTEKAVNSQNEIKKYYIYKNKNNQIILPDFIFSIYSQYNLKNGKDANDFAYYTLSNIAGKTNILYNNEQLDDEALEFYTILYRIIDKEGGIDNCAMLSDYIQNLSDRASLQKLITDKCIKKIEVSLYANGDVIEENKKQVILKQYIIRNVNGFVILPETIYYAYRNYIGNNSNEFAKYVIESSYPSENISEDTFNYFKAIYNLIEKDGNCINLSDYFNEKYYKNYHEMILSFLKFDKFKMYRIDIYEDGTIDETRVNSTELLNTIYDKEQAKIENDYIDFMPNLKRIDKKIDKYKKEMHVNTKEEYQNCKDTIHAFETEIYSVINEIKVSEENCEDKNMLNNLNQAEKYSAILLSKIEKSKLKLETLYSECKSQYTSDSIEYYEEIKKSIEQIVTNIMNIKQEMNITCEEDYKKYHSNLSQLKDKLFDIYNNSLQTVFFDENIKGTIIKEAITKYNNAITSTDEVFELLEDRRAALLKKHIFES